jgi:hypothetical protein
MLHLELDGRGVRYEQLARALRNAYVTPEIGVHAARSAQPKAWGDRLRHDASISGLPIAHRV